MGTRNLTCVYVDGEYRVAQYCQWDGYPSGQGKTVYNFLKKRSPNKLAKQVRKNTRLITDDEIDEMNKSVGATNGWITMDQSDELKRRYPNMHRDTGAGILEMIYNSKTPVAVRNDIEFVENGLSCEWVYVIDLDDNTLEVYTGIWEGDAVPAARFRSSGMRGNVQLRAKYPLDKLPTLKKFYHDLGDDE